MRKEIGANALCAPLIVGGGFLSLFLFYRFIGAFGRVRMLKAVRNLFGTLQRLEFPTPAAAVNQISHKSTLSKTFGPAQPKL